MNQLIAGALISFFGFVLMISARPPKQKVTIAEKETFEDVIEWFHNQSNRWVTKDNAINFNKYQEIVNDELKPKIGIHLQKLFPGISYCEHCKWPWHLVESKHISLDKTSGCFATCVTCWNHILSNQGGEAKLRKVWHKARVKYWPDTTKEQLDTALDKAIKEKK